jgi:outer membrane protein assembly factor BamB
MRVVAGVRSRVLTFPVLFALFVVLSSCARNRPPEVPAAPAGPAYCYKDTAYFFTASAVDPEGDSVAIRFDWGDSSVTYWEGWLASGETIALSHAWSHTGRYEMRASAEDVAQHVSGPSEGHTVRVGYRWPPNAPSQPAGPDTGFTDTSYTFASVAVHPGGATVAIRFAWGDGDTSDWSPFIASGESVRINHVWTSTGMYAVTAQAKDTGNALSEWSTPHNLAVQLLKWRFRIAPGGRLCMRSSPAIGPDGTIYVGSADSSLYAVNPDGTFKWRYRTMCDMQTSPVVTAKGTVHLVTFFTLDALIPDGTLLESSHLWNEPMSSPALDAHDSVYVTLEGYVVGFPNCSTDDMGWAAPGFARDRTAYILLRNADIIACYPNGDVKWRYTGWGLNPTDPAIAADGTLYAGMEYCLGTDFRAMNPDGTLKWACLMGHDVRSSPSVGADGTIYFGASDNYLYALNPDGTLKWRFETGGYVNTGPALAEDGTIYVGSGDGYLYAVNADGTLKWQYQTGGSVESSPNIGTDGTVYFASGDGYLYALDGKSPLASAPWPKYHHDVRNTACAVSR